MLESLRPRFLETLKKRQLILLELRKSLAASEPGENTFAVLDKVARIIQRSAATFMYDDVASAAAALGNAVEQRSVRADSKTILNAVDTLLKACRTAQRVDRGKQSASSQTSKPAPVSQAQPPDDAPIIVLVEDNPATQLIVRKLLAGEGIVYCADNVEDARRLIEELSPSLAIVDNKLIGEATGLDLIEMLKADPRYADIPVIMLAASDEPEVIMRALLADAVDYISKPIDPKIFTEKIGEFLRARSTLVLMGDDDASVREILARKFHAIGVKTVEAETGDDAIALARSRKPDLVLLERMLPGLDGVAVLQKILNDPTLRHIPVVFLTARRHDNDILEGLRLGAADYIVKPFNSDIVVSRCMRFIKTREAAA